MKCEHCPGNITERMWRVEVLPTKVRIMCDFCKDDFKHNPMTEILPRRNKFMCWIRRLLKVVLA